MRNGGKSEGSRGKRMNKVALILYILGTASLLYFVICFSYAGLSASFTYVWGIGGVLSILVGVILQRLMLHGFVWPMWIKIVVATVLIVGAGLFIYAESLIIYHGNQEAPENVEYLVVLGARVNGTRITGSLWRRLNAAVDYLNEESNPDTKVIVSGGQGPGEDISEAQAMHDYLIEKGIAKDRIIMEDQSTNTYENIKFSREIIQDDNATVAIVTNGFHIYRGTSMAKTHGMTKVSGLSASSDPIMAFSYYVREGFAVVAYKLKGMI